MMSREAAADAGVKMEADYRAFIENQFYQHMIAALYERAKALEAANVSVKTPAAEREQNAGAHDEVVHALSLIGSLRARESSKIQAVIRAAELREAKREKPEDAGDAEGDGAERVGASGRARRDKAF